MKLFEPRHPHTSNLTVPPRVLPPPRLEMAVASVAEIVAKTHMNGIADFLCARNEVSVNGEALPQRQGFENGSGSRTRTYDPRINSPLLYQLSYAGTSLAAAESSRAAAAKSSRLNHAPRRIVPLRRAPASAVSRIAHRRSSHGSHGPLASPIAAFCVPSRPTSRSLNSQCSILN